MLLLPLTRQRYRKPRLLPHQFRYRKGYLNHRLDRHYHLARQEAILVPPSCWKTLLAKPDFEPSAPEAVNLPLACLPVTHLPGSGASNQMAGESHLTWCRMRPYLAWLPATSEIVTPHSGKRSR